MDWLAVITAQTTGGGGDLPGWVPVVASALAGIFVTALSGKLVVPSFAYQRERERADYWQGEYMTLSNKINGQVVVALTESTTSVRESSEAIKQSIAALGRRQR